MPDRRFTDENESALAMAQGALGAVVGLLAAVNMNDLGPVQAADMTDLLALIHREMDKAMPQELGCPKPRLVV